MRHRSRLFTLAGLSVDFVTPKGERSVSAARVRRRFFALKIS
ncbi:MAG: hypothetical protein U0166_16795 [Acidobacteriota bacterium]